MQKVFFSNKNVFGNLMLTSCKQARSVQNEQDGTVSTVVEDILMFHRIKDLFQTQNDGKMINCMKLALYIPKDFV